MTFYRIIASKNAEAFRYETLFNISRLLSSRKSISLTQVKRAHHSSYTRMTPDGVHLNFKLNVDEIAKRCDELLERTKKVYDQVALLPNNELTYVNVVEALGIDECEYNVSRNNIDFLQHISEDKDIRAASTEADKKLTQFDVEMSMRKDVFDNLVAYSEKKENIKPEAQRFLDRCIRDGRRNGLHLEESLRDRIKEIKKECGDLGIEFNKNCNEENTILEFSKDELDGLPDDFLESLEKSTNNPDKFQVSLKYPHYFPCQKKAKNPVTRQKMQIAFDSRCVAEGNAKILEKLVELRHEKAQILGYSTHASFITSIRMSKSAEVVKNFLSELAKKLASLGQSELALMREMKKSETGDDSDIRYWDFRYYMNKIEEEKYSVDHEKLKEYFPIEIVTKGLLEIYQELLSLEYEQVDNADTWHQDVSMYSVRDAGSKQLLGYFYLDLFPRDGKFSHAACFGLQPGCVDRSGKRQLSVAAMVANFTKPTKDKPALLTHNEVETFFHEFGHVMHQICAEAEFARFSGTAVERDFVEAPSQMLENWCWEKEALCRMSKHYKDGSVIPDDLLDKLILSRKANAGVFNLRQILLGTFDQEIHTSAKADTAAVFSKKSEEILQIPTSEGTNKAAAFGHLAGGYDAQYYGYMWSEVYSMDMFASRFKKEGIFNKKVGSDYRNFILKPGGSIDAIDMITKFLGRPPNDNAFLISKGLEISQ